MSAKVWLVGAGPGDPELLTLKAVKALQQADIVMIDDLVNPAVLEHCPAARVVPVGKRGGCRSTPQAFIHRLMLRYARQGKCVVRLKGGDPCVFGRGSEEADWLAEHGIEVEMVNGITAGLAGATQCGIPLTLRGVARGVTLVTAHTQDDSSLNWQALAQGGTTLVVYMGVAKLPEVRDSLPAEFRWRRARRRKPCVRPWRARWTFRWTGSCSIRCLPGAASMRGSMRSTRFRRRWWRAGRGGRCS